MLSTAAKQQVQPQCAYFGMCGGCAFQDVAYPVQLELKRKLVEEALCPNDNFTISPVLPSPKPYHYRHMVALTVKRRHGLLHLGFIGADGKSFVPIDNCPIAEERINHFLPVALSRLENLPPKRKYRTSQIVLRIGQEGKVITSLREDGEGSLECRVDDKIFSYSISSFFQNNFSILDSFIEVLRRLLRTEEQGTLFDLYSGVGLIGISLADQYKQVVGIEEGYEAARHAKKNAERNQIRNALFLEGKVEMLLPDLIRVAKRPLHVVVDPPRIGLKPEVLGVLVRARHAAPLPIDKVVYVSCHLDALKRDLRMLRDHFNIQEVQPMDFFPQTKHIETIVLLEKKL